MERIIQQKQRKGTLLLNDNRPKSFTERLQRGQSQATEQSHSQHQLDTAPGRTSSTKGSTIKQRANLDREPKEQGHFQQHKRSDHAMPKFRPGKPNIRQQSWRPMLSGHIASNLGENSFNAGSQRKQKMLKLRGGGNCLSGFVSEANEEVQEGEGNSNCFTGTRVNINNTGGGVVYYKSQKFESRHEESSEQSQEQQ
jgi:hypothetical protein